MARAIWALLVLGAQESWPGCWAVDSGAFGARRVQGNASSCPWPWTRIGRHCFWLSDDAHNFEHCQRDVCGSRGATLACIRKDESAGISWAMGVNHVEQLTAWIGYMDYGEERGGWAWINGDNSNYTNWRPGDPDEYCGNEDCAALIGANSYWMDISCRVRLPCLCEYQATVTELYSISLPDLRDDTCYSNCGDYTRWCSAWPFSHLRDTGTDLCGWDEEGANRGRGAGECIKRSAAREDCGEYVTYASGRCRCSPASGRHSNCTLRSPDVASDVFHLMPGGAELVISGQRCEYANDLDVEYFLTLSPSRSFGASFLRWLKAAGVWLFFGVPCGCVMLWVLRHMGATCAASVNGADGSGDGGAAGAGEEAAYGPLIDNQLEEGASEAVNRWICRAALGIMLYGLALLALGATLAAHMKELVTTFNLEFFEALTMALAKAMVARACCIVHRSLTPVAKQVAGPWVLVVALSKVFMSVSAFCGALIFGTLADRDFEHICFAMYLFRWSLVLALPLQCLAGFAIWRLQVRAARYAGGEARVNGWVTMFVVGTFGSGAGVWLGGYTDTVHEAGVATVLSFFAAAVSQLLAGVALLLVNQKVKQHFRKRTQHAEVPAVQIGQPVADDQIYF